MSWIVTVVFMMYSVSMRVRVEFDSAFYNTYILKTNITVMYSIC